MLISLCVGIEISEPMSHLKSPDKTAEIILSKNEDESNNVIIKTRSSDQIILANVSKVKIYSLWSENSDFLFLRVDYGTKNQVIHIINIGKFENKVLKIVGVDGSVVSLNGSEIYPIKWDKKIIVILKVNSKQLELYSCKVDENKNEAILKLEKSESVPIDNLQTRINEIRGGQ